MRRRVVHLHPRNGNFIVAGKWLPPCQYMKSRDAKRINIAGGGEFELACRLFGRHVIHRADTRIGGSKNRAAIQFGNAKICQHGATIGPQQNIGGFDITVDDTRLVNKMCVIERLGDIGQNGQKFLRAKCL